MAIQRMGADEVDGRLKDLPGWTVIDGTLRRDFKFASFVEAFGFMASCALVAEKHDHHPDWKNVWNRVEVALSTHDAGGITERDFALAAAMNQIAARYA